MVKLIPKSRVTKVNLSWAAIIAVGISAFVAAKYSVEHNRVEVMRSKRRIQQARQQDCQDLLHPTEQGEKS